MLQLNEWGLAGRGFGMFISWFLLGGDIYTAYTFIAVPALVFASGSIGFYAVSYAIMVYPIAFIFLPRLWSVSRVHDYVTPADFIRGRYGSRGLSLAAAFTGILALMPYIALQLVGIQAVLTVMGVGDSSTNTYVRNIPLFVAFLVLAIFTYVSGLRAPSLIAFIKDALVYVFVLVALFYIPTRLGGWSHIFGHAQVHLASISPATKKPVGSFLPTSKSVGSTQFDFATLALGSAIALFLYPHAITGTLATKRRAIVKRNLSFQPALRDPARLHRAVRLHGARRPAHRREREEGRQHPARGAVPDPAHVPIVVRGHRVLGDHHRGAGPGRDHVDRRRQPVHPQRLQRVLQAGRVSPSWRRGCRSGCRWWSSWARCSSRWNCRTRSPSTSSCSAASGYCSSRRC